MFKVKPVDLSAYKKSLPPECLKDYAIIFDGPSPQYTEFSEIPYLDHNNNKKIIVSAVYNVLHKTLPSSLSTLLPPPPAAYELRDIPGKGKGLIATRDIAFGELVIVERPVLLCPFLMDDVTSVVNFQIHARLSMKREDWIKFNDLVNVQNTNFTRFDGIRRTNAFAIDLQKGKEGYSGIFLEQSRLNHSCGPNLRSTWDPYLFTLSVQAACPIRAGEELTISYVTLSSPYTDRQNILQKVYKFTCKCPCCVKPLPTSDSNRQSLIPDVTYTVFEATYDLLTTPDVPRHTLLPMVIELRSTLLGMLATSKKECIDSVAAPIIYVCLMKLSGIMGDKKEFHEWGFKAILCPVNYTEHAGGKMYSELELWIDCMRDPEKKFPEWGLYQQSLPSLNAFIHE